MTTKDEVRSTVEALRVERALQLALEALKSVADHRPNDETNAAITAIRVALASKSEALAEQPRLLSAAPCDQCGYNGPGYYQPDTHQCAAKHHKALADQPAQQALDKMAENARELGLDYEPAQPYPDNFIHALMYDVAKRDSEAQQAYEDAFVNGTGVMIGDKRIDSASIYKQPEQEPVAWMFQHEETGRTMCVDAQQVEWGFEKGNPRLKKIAPLYTSPPASKTWVGLTDEQINEFFEGIEPNNGCWLSFARAIEAKLKEKNNG